MNAVIEGLRRWEFEDGKLEALRERVLGLRPG